MAPDLPKPVIGLVTLWVNTILYSFNIVFFVVCLWLLLKKRRTGDATSWILISCISIQFVLSTLHIAMMLAAGVHAFLSVKTTAAAVSAAWIDHFAVFTETQQLAHALSNVFGDLILVWRCYVVYGNNWYIIILPLLLALGSGACNIFISADIYIHPERILSLTPVVEAGFAATAATQILVTLLIGGKIWWVSRGLSSKYMGIVWMLVESGAGLAIAEIIWLTWNNRIHGLSQLLLGMLGQLCALIPLAIIVRVGLGLAVGSTKKNTLSRLSTFSPASRSTLPQWRSGRTRATDTTATVDSDGVLASRWKDETEGSAQTHEVEVPL